MIAAAATTYRMPQHQLYRRSGASSLNATFLMGIEMCGWVDARKFVYLGLFGKRENERIWGRLYADHL